MRYAVSAAQMRGIEQDAINEQKIPALILMENAAMRTVAHVRRFLCGNKNCAVIVCGPGNNGGDGYALARQLFSSGVDVTVITAGKPRTEDALVNFEIIKNIGIPILNYPVDKCEKALLGADVSVDAVFGVGLTRPLEGIYADLIGLINGSGKNIISLDVPSGMDSDTGRVSGAAVRADCTVTYGYVKTGLLLYPGADYTGEVITEGLSLPPKDESAFIRVIEDADIPVMLPARKPDSNKGMHGRVCVLAGSAEMPGAAVLCCMSAYKAGAGLVDACVTPEVARVIHAHLPEAVTTILARENFKEKTLAAGVKRRSRFSSEIRQAGIKDVSRNQIIFQCMKKASVVVAGPGLGQGGVEGTSRLTGLPGAGVNDFVKFILENAECPVVLDADGLNAVSAIGVDCLKKIKPLYVITPHPGEMSRLTGLSVAEILKEPLRAAHEFSRNYNVTVLLKGARTVIAAPDGTTYINTSGCAALAKAGAGDALAGIIAGLIAQGAEVCEAAALGAFLHGRAGEKAAEKLSLYGVNARDVIDALPGVMDGVK